MRTEKIVVANVHGGSNRQGSGLAAWLKGLGFTIALISELGNLIDDLDRVGKVFYNRKEGRPHDVGIVVAHSMVARAGKALSWIGGRLTRFIRRPGSASPRLWRDRWFVRVRIFGRVFYAIHANAAIAGPEGNWINSKGAHEWRMALVKLHRMIQADMEKGLRVRVGGDFNFPESDARLSPNNFFDSLNLNWFSDDRVMYFAWDPCRDELVSKKELPTAPGADAHGVLLVELKKRRGRR